MKCLQMMAVLAAVMFLGAGCETYDKPKEPKKQEQKRKVSKEEKQRKKRRDPIADMLRIERKESKPFLADSEELSSSEKKAFSDSWSSQYKESEEIHKKVRSQHEREKDKKDSWVFY